MFVKSIAVAGTLALLLACGSQVGGGAMATEHEFDAAWERVREASDAQVQRDAVVEFLRRNEQSGAPALQVSVTHRDTGAKAAIDDALWQHPDRYEVTLRYGARSHVFVPLSSASLEPLFRE